MNTPLPNLPLVDGAFLIDNSSLEKLVCPRFYELHCLRRRSLAVAKAGRNFGSALHVGWRTRYSLCGTDAVNGSSAARINSAMAEYFETSPQPPDDFRTLEHAQKVMAAYNDFYRTEPWKLLKRADGQPAIESSFIFDIGEVRYPSAKDPSWSQVIPVKYIGRVDLFIENNDGPWVFDHKTAFQFGEGFRRQMESNAGQIGYCWAFEQFYGKPPRGYIIDAVRIRRPRKGDEYSDIAPCDASDLQRMPFYVMPDTIDEWKTNVLAQVQSIFRMHSAGFFHQNKALCEAKYGPCDFYDTCSAPRTTRDEILSSSLYEPNDWTPLNVPLKGVSE